MAKKNTVEQYLFQNLLIKLGLLISSHNPVDLGKGFLKNKNYTKYDSEEMLIEYVCGYLWRWEVSFQV